MLSFEGATGSVPSSDELDALTFGEDIAERVGLFIKYWLRCPFKTAAENKKCYEEVRKRITFNNKEENSICKRKDLKVLCLAIRSTKLSALHDFY